MSISGREKSIVPKQACLFFLIYRHNNYYEWRQLYVCVICQTYLLTVMLLLIN